jgi:hypothetical protein
MPTIIVAPDILWHNAATGEIQIWFMHGELPNCVTQG